ncbi:acyl-CoA N-acyltransferase [Mycena rosella]|uniref:Acyl-CoA N-acyltransferase n=1 Tax=Mycena rosella TaxID=1033263 RepID=A0AAD7H1E2_MYCRO|nr:acyl-CoA N-acyltransferase [Mycena rosella]
MDNHAYHIFSIPVPVSEEHVDKYRELRLLALTTNPEAFGSKYEDNVDKTRAQWRAMIDTPERFTAVARVLSTGEWAGMASILTPEMAGQHTGDTGPNPHLLVGMWVRPAHRRKGLGKRLIGAGIEWVRTRTEGMPDKKRQVTLEVHRHNESAKALYDGLGFVVTDGECEDSNRIPMFVVAK